MTCEKFKDTMGVYIDGLLAGEELREFQGHLSVCSTCRQEVEELQSMLSWLKQVGDVAPPKDLRKSVLAELKNEQNRKGRRYFPGFSQAVAAAAVLIMLVVGNIYLHPPAPISDAVPMRAAYEAEPEAATSPGDATIFTKEERENEQVSEKNDMSSGTQRNLFPGRLVLNLVLVPFFLFFSLRALQKIKEALP